MTLPTTRQEKVLRHVDRRGVGLEIGSSYNSIAAKRDGYNVQFIDHATREQLVAKFRHHDVDVDSIEEVDFIWNGEDYATLTGRPKSYDWIIASHIIEHTPDLIGFLNSCDAVLKDEGVLSLAVPDKRYCFDRHRPLTGLARVIDSHHQKNTRHTLGTLAEAHLNAVTKGGDLGWAAGNPYECEFIHSPETVRELVRQAAETTAYIDHHAWCFVPHSFRLLLNDLHLLGLTQLREVDFSPTEGHEFFVTLGRRGTGSGLSRDDLVRHVDRELAEVAMAVAAPAPRRPLWIRLARRFLGRK